KADAGQDGFTAIVRQQPAGGKYTCGFGQKWRSGQECGFEQKCRSGQKCGFGKKCRSGQRCGFG
ncbi:MAG: hypothetical protein K2O98_08665, partial [Lachnospiraceae bacterium]|nr:hypothetical protein [Lachnospiraceae bacterium]